MSHPVLPHTPSTASAWLPRPAGYLRGSLLDLAKSRGIRVEFVETSGGPGAGKTSIQLRLEFEFTQLGWFVSVLPEAATIIRNMGFRAEEGKIPNAVAQQMIMDLNQHLRLQALAAAIDAKGVDKVLLIGDRSDLDCIPYLTSRRGFPDALASRGLNIGDIIGDSVHHLFLRSLAVDDPKLYEEICRENRARKETKAEEAVKKDEDTLAGIREYVNPVVIDNKGEGGFEGKMQRAVDAIRLMLDEATVQQQNAYLVTAYPMELVTGLGLSTERFTLIEQFYARSGMRYRMTEYPGGHRVFAMTNKTDGGKPGYRFALTERVHPDVYHEAFETRDRDLRVIRKRRYSGICRGVESVGPSGLFVTVDVFESNLLPHNLNRVEVYNSAESVIIPPGISEYPYRDVTGLDGFSNLDIAMNRFQW